MSITQYDGLGSGVGNQSYTGTGRDPDDRTMDEEQFAAAVRAAIDDASMYIDGYVAPYREAATRYYRGDLFGNEEAGRSQIVMTEVRDTVLAMMPSLLRIFTSSDEAVSFEPRTAEKVEMAEQATDYVNYLFYNDNDGFQVLYNAFKDALIRKTGILKWYWDDSLEIYETRFTGLSDGQLQLLSIDPEVEIIDKQSKPDEFTQMMLQKAQEAQQQMAMQAAQAPPPQQMPPGGAAMPPGAPPPPVPPPGAPGAAGAASSAGAAPAPPPMPMLHDVAIRRRVARNKVKIEALPVEEFLCSRTARDLDTAHLIGHRSVKSYSDLIAMGYDETIVEELSGADTFQINTEAQARNPAVSSFTQNLDISDESATKVVYNEVWVRVDRDGDGIAELHKVCMVGTTVLHDEIVRDVPIAVICPDPEPHMVIGNSVADQTMDLQLIKSNVVRNTLDSLSQAIHPRTVVVEGQVNLDDALNVETGAIIRAKAPGMIQPLAEPFVGQAAMPVIQWLDEVKALRTGIIPATAGLDPDVLQSTTKTAVDAAVMGAQERTEMTARLFAENGMKRMMKGVLKLVCEHQDKPRMIRLRGKWTEVNPRSWDADMDVIVHVALGRGTEQARLAGLAGIAAKQEMAMQVGGTTNPLADLSRYRNTLAKMTELLGFKDVQQFFAPIDMQQIAQLKQQQEANPPPDPQMVVAQAEQAKAQSQIESHKLEDATKQQQALFEAEMETQRMQLEIWKVKMEDARLREKMRLDALVAAQKNEATLGLAASAQDGDTGLERDRLIGDMLRGQVQADNDANLATMQLEADLAKHAATLATQRAIARERPKPTNGGAR